MLWDQKILIFGAPEAPTKGGTLLLAKTLPNPLKKPWFWGGEALGGTVTGGILDPLKH